MNSRSKKVNEAKNFVEKFIGINNQPPGYSEIAYALSISKRAAYNLCDKFRHKLRNCDLTTEEKTTHLDIALRLCRIDIPKDKLELMVRLYDAICESDGVITVDEILDIQSESNEKENSNNRE